MEIAAAPDATLADVLDRAVAGHPAPSAIAPELIAEAQQEFSTPAHQTTTAARVYPDGFDPNVHTYPPEKTARGTWRKLRKGQTNNLDALRPSPAQFDAAAESQPGQSPSAAAENICATFFAIAPALLNGSTGVDWKPTTEEREAVEQALARYFAVNGSIDLPPGVALLAAVGTYALPRAMATPAVQRLYTRTAAKLFGAQPVTADNAGDGAQLYPTTPSDPHEQPTTIGSMYSNDDVVTRAA